MDQKTRNRMIALCGMLGSNHDGEVLNAARAAHALLVKHGMSWEQFLNLGATKEDAYERSPPKRETTRHDAHIWNHRDIAESLIARAIYRMTEKERTFVSQMVVWDNPTPKQRDWLNTIDKKYV